MRNIFCFLIISLLSLFSFNITFGGNVCEYKIFDKTLINDNNYFNNNKFFGINSLIFSNDGKRMAFISEFNGEKYVVIDGIKSKKYDIIEDLHYSSKLNNFIFKAKNYNEPYIEIKNGVEKDNLEKYSDALDLFPDNIIRSNTAISVIGFLPNGDDPIFRVLNLITKKEFYVFNGIKTATYSYIQEFNYTLDGKGYYFIGVNDFKDKDREYIIVKNGKELYKSNNISQLHYLPDSDSFIWLNFSNGKIGIVKDGVEYKKYELLISFIVARNGQSYAAIFKDGNYYMVFKDGVEEKQYKDIKNIKYSNDSTSFSYVATEDDGTTLIIKDGIEVYHLGANSMVYDITYSAIGNNLYFITKDINTSNRYLFKETCSQKEIIEKESIKSKGDVFGLECNIKNNKTLNYQTKLFFNGGKSLFLVDFNNKNFILDGVVNYLPIELQNNSINYSIIKSNGIETITASINNFDSKDESNNFFILNNNTFVKYNVLFSENKYIEYHGLIGIAVLENNDNIFISIGSNEWFSLKKSEFNYIDGIKIKDLIISKDEKQYLLSIELPNGKFMIIKDGKVSKEYINISGLSFLKNDDGFGFQGMSIINKNKKEAKGEFVLNFNNKLDLLYIGKDGKEYIKFGDDLLKSDSVGFEVLNNIIYYYGITENNKFNIYRGKNTLLSVDTNSDYTTINSISSENDNFITFYFTDGDGNNIVINNENGKFNIIYKLYFREKKINDSIFSFEGIERIWINKVIYMKNNSFYILSVKKDNGEYYELVVKNLDFKTLPDLKYNSILNSDYFKELIKGNNNYFIGTKNDGSKYVFDFNGKTSINIKKEGFSGIIGITDNLDVIYLLSENKGIYSIYENDKLLTKTDNLLSLKIEFSNDFKNYSIIGLYNNKTFFFIGGKKYNTNGNYFVSTSDLKFIQVGDSVFKDMKIFTNNNKSYFKKIGYSLDKKNLILEDGYSYYNCGLVVKQKIVVYKSKPQLFKQLILSKKELNKTFKGRKYIYAIDLISKKLSKQKLEKLIGKLENIDTSLVEYRKYKDMLDYLEAKIGLELLK